MTLYDVCGDIGPNGLHDARFRSFHIDWVTREASIACNLWVGGDFPDPAAREARRHGTLTLTGLLYFVIEPPDPNYPFEDSPKGLDITSDGPTFTLDPPPALPSVEGEEGVFTHFFFVNDWNVCVYVAATGAAFRWD